MVDGLHQRGEREKAVGPARQQGIQDRAIAPTGLAVVECGAVRHDPLDRIVEIIESECRTQLGHHGSGQLGDDVRDPLLEPAGDVGLPDIGLLPYVMGQCRDHQDSLFCLG